AGPSAGALAWPPDTRSDSCQGTSTITRLRDTNCYEPNRWSRTTRGPCLLRSAWENGGKRGENGGGRVLRRHLSTANLLLQISPPKRMSPCLLPGFGPSPAVENEDRMSKQTGRNLPLSPLRRLVGDHQHFCGKVPGATVERPLSLAALRAARQACVPRPSWCAIFLKAMSMVGARHPQFRRAFLPFPWPHLYEHPDNIANFTIERRYQDEDVVFYAQVRRPERRSLTELDAIIQTCKDAPVEAVKFFRRAIRLSKVPWPFRRLAWWGSLNLSGK